MLIEATASHPAPTSYGVENGIDVDVELTVDGRTWSGGVTLVPDHTGEYNSWGGPEHWLSQELQDAASESSDFRAVCEEIRAAAVQEINAAHL